MYVCMYIQADNTKGYGTFSNIYFLMGTFYFLYFLPEVFRKLAECFSVLRERLETEVLLDDIQRQEKDENVEASPELRAFLLAESSTFRWSHYSKIVSNDHVMAAKQLIENKKTVIWLLDKTAAFVLINKEEYNEMINYT